MAYKVPSVLGAIDLFLEFITANSAAITAKGMTPATLTTALTALKAALQQKEIAQEAAKTAMKDATLALDAQSILTYDGFSSLVDFMSGGLGKKTNLAKQLRKIRGDVRPSGSTPGSSSSSSSGDPGSSSGDPGSSSS